MTQGERDMPRWLRYACTAFVAVLVPVYWRHYGPANFLWFSDLALFAILITLWTRHPLPASMGAVGVLPLEIVWTVDFLLLLLLGASPTGLTGYMTMAEIPLHVRALSLFHVALPPLFLWITRRLGYDRRAWRYQSLLALVVMPVTYLVSGPDTNINWAYGPSQPQDWMPPLAWVAIMMAALPIIYRAVHRGLVKWNQGSGCKVQGSRF
jgi:hypothetical protein